MIVVRGPRLGIPWEFQLFIIEYLPVFSFSFSVFSDIRTSRYCVISTTVIIKSLQSVSLDLTIDLRHFHRNCCDGVVSFTMVSMWLIHSIKSIPGNVVSLFRKTHTLPLLVFGSSNKDGNQLFRLYWFFRFPICEFSYYVE